MNLYMRHGCFFFNVHHMLFFIIYCDIFVVDLIKSTKVRLINLSKVG